MNVTLLMCLLCFFCGCANALQCIDENNNEVDWYILYKIPHVKNANTTNKLIKKGFAYLYITSSDQTIEWKLSNVNILDPERSILARTLKPLYDRNTSDNLLHILYNDEPPSKKDTDRGHTKGIVVGDDKGGFWIVHSVPLYPPLPSETYSYPLTGTVYGQSILCMSFNDQQFDNIGIQLQFNEPAIYSKNLPNNLSAKYPTLTKIINGNITPQNEDTHNLDLTTIHGMHFLSFAKSKNFGKDLYEDWVAPTLKVNLLVETWLNGPGKLPSNCSKSYSVKNIKEIYLDVAKITFPSSHDHSKWAVSAKQSWICIGDINRAEHQEKRGGGTVCINNEQIANLYRKAIVMIENCS